MQQDLARQLQRLGMDRGSLPRLEAWQEFVVWVDKTAGAIARERDVVRESMNAISVEVNELTTALASERDKFASVFRAVPNGMAITDLDGRMIEVNEALEAMVGLSGEQLVGKVAWELVDGDSAGLFRSTMEGLAAARITSDHGHYRLVSSRAEPVLADTNCTAVNGIDGKPTFLAIVFDDVTQKTRLEVELRHAQKLESVGRLAAGIAHEINTPIQFVGDNVTFLASAFESLLTLCRAYQGLCDRAVTAPLSADDIKQRAKDEELGDLAYIAANIPMSIASTIDGVGRVARIVQSMKAFAHPDSDKRTIADINMAMRNTLVVATNELKHVATVETEYGDVPPVPCFLSDLNQVFLNLLVNAAHAIGDVVGGGGQSGIIRVKTYVEPEHAVIAISDTGTGIPKAVQPKIFDPFFTTKVVGRGTGQGLALAHSVVVERHGGTITFETEAGKGTTFFVRIPLNPVD